MRVLVPVDGSAPSNDALAYALERFRDAEFIALYVMDPVDRATAWGPGRTDDWLSAAEEHSETVLDAALDAADADVAIMTDAVVGRPAHAVVEYADEHDVDHVVVGSHGRDGISRMLLGSVAETVVRRSPVPVTVCRS